MYPNLYAEMARRDITQNLLSKKINKTPTTVSMKLNGKADLTLSECMEIKNAVDPDLSLEFLFERKEEIK